jgi:hypothetical protein
MNENLLIDDVRKEKEPSGKEAALTVLNGEIANLHEMVDGGYNILPHSKME